MFEAVQGRPRDVARERQRPEKLLAKPPDIRSTKKVEPVKATTEEEEPDPDAVDTKAAMADEADDVPKSARPSSWTSAWRPLSVRATARLGGGASAGRTRRRLLQM